MRVSDACGIAQQFITFKPTVGYDSAWSDARAENQHVKISQHNNTRSSDELLSETGNGGIDGLEPGYLDRVLCARHTKTICWKYF